VNLLLLLAALSLVKSARPAPVALARASDPTPVTLAALRSEPARYLGEEVRFALQFRALVEDWEPYLSRFDSARWLALEGWADETFTWDQPVFDAPAGHLFVRRGGGFEPLVRRAHTYQRFEVRARVREVFLGAPWLEVLELTPLEGEVGEGTIVSVTRARDLVAQGEFDLALEQFERARAAPLPPHALAALLEEMRFTRAARDLNPTKDENGLDEKKDKKDKEKKEDGDEGEQGVSKEASSPVVVPVNVRPRQRKRKTRLSVGISPRRRSLESGSRRAGLPA